MLNFLRGYLYWSVLWGLLAHPDVGLKTIAPMLLTGIDILVLSVTLCYSIAGAMGAPDETLRRELRTTLALVCALFFYALGVTQLAGGVVADAAKYLAVLLRPMLLLICVTLVALAHPPEQAAKLERQLRGDIWLVTLVQLTIALIQLLNPTEGVRFIAALSDSHSATWTFEEGDLPGSFANSIDLAYFLLASYIVLTLPAWRRVQQPAWLVTLGAGFFVQATGSDAATVCFLVYASFLHLRSLPLRARKMLLLAAAMLSAALLYSQFDLLMEGSIDKVDNMMLSRLGLLFVSLPGLVQTMPHMLVLGSGADFEAVAALLQSLPDVPLAFTYEDAAVFINDVFWVALLLSLGIPFTLIYLWRMLRLMRRYLQLDAAEPMRKNLFWMLVIVIGLAGLLNQILLVRSFTTPLLIGLMPLALMSRASARCAT